MPTSAEEIIDWNKSKYAIQLPHELKYADVVIGDKVIYIEVYNNEPLMGEVRNIDPRKGVQIKWTFLIRDQKSTSTSWYERNWHSITRLHFFRTEKEELALRLRFGYYEDLESN